ncbi:uncharacterized protein YbjQ (UPF0145 family) [Parabacteroides sp. PF5-6]|nr:uncharacterized protein YbjQ (UPF0145 family) [Parabacteroides sp. PF5-6]
MHLSISQASLDLHSAFTTFVPNNKIMLLTTTNSLEGKEIIQYFGIVSGETIIGANIVKDFFAGITDIVGGRSGSYEKVLKQAKDAALQEMADQATRMGANAVIGIDLDYETVGSTNSMLMVTAAGTAVRYK